MSAWVTASGQRCRAVPAASPTTVVAVPDSVAIVTRSPRERSPSPLSVGSSPALLRAEPPAPDRATPSEEIRREVQELLEKDLLVTDDDGVAKVAAMETLGGYFDTDGASPEEIQVRLEYCRWVEDWNGCHFVLAALRRELDKAGNGTPNRDVADSALLFLYRWNGTAGRCDTMSRFRGVETVARAMRAFPHDADIQDAAILCFCSFTFDNDVTRRRELVEGGVIPLAFRAVAAPACEMRTRQNAATLLGSLCDVAEPHRFDGLVEKGALEAVAAVVRAYKSSGGRDSEEGLEACRKLMTKLI